MHTYGSHFEYNKRYTPDLAYFTPEHNSAASFENRKELINAYDNTIRYTDMLLSRVIDVLKQTGEVASMIYVSDHGEDIYDDERHRFLHASPVATYYQLHVPMVVWTSDKYNEMYPEKVAALKANSARNVSSTASLFHTILDMSGVSSPFYDKASSLSSAEYHEPRRYYLNDYNEAVQLDKSGLRDYDLDMLKKNKISTY